MPYVVARKPSGVHYVQLVGSKEECILYDVAIRKLFTVPDEAEVETKRLNKERRKRHQAIVASQMKLLDDDGPPGLEYLP